tara:strand:- start:1380 stop:1595 length:216 start_codon:yes stop_codon:yes gene_type:complete
MKVVITDQDTVLDINLTKIISAHYPKLDKIQVEIIADEIKSHPQLLYKPVYNLVQDYCKQKRITLKDYEQE